MFLSKYDVIVVGGGHAGCEAASAAANMGAQTLLVTMNLQNIAQMSCNPAMGGIAKGQIVREIDALGGYSGIVTDRTMIQFKMLNKSKGPAMWSPRAQSDRMQFAKEWRAMLESLPTLDFYQEMVTELWVKNGCLQGVITSLGVHIESKAVVLTNGTFLNGLIHIGDKQYAGGRVGEAAAKGLTAQLVNLGFVSGRMKTGTPPRVDGRSLDYNKMIVQPGDDRPEKFSFLDTPPLLEQMNCHMTYTSEKVHDILREGFDRSPMFNGRIKSIGPRYCPSIEDKINRFADKERHQIFVEPEGRTTCEVYVNGFSTSLPHEIQAKALRIMDGFNNAKLLRPGYAIEYDYFPPTQLKLTLETKLMENLYFAGQINGTTGYEEAAAQGLMAGINAVRKIQEEDPFVLGRNEAYIGVLIDDLVTKGTEEPYRMFTSRAEYRLLLRQDNADERLTRKGYEIGLASQERLKRYESKSTAVDKLVNFFKETSVSSEEINPLLIKLGSTVVEHGLKLKQILTRPQITLKDLEALPHVQEYLEENTFDQEEKEEAEISVKYEGYILRESENAKKLIRLEQIVLPEDVDYTKFQSISSEAKEKLQHIRPSTIGQASRISGISPADISVLLTYMKR